jgi:septum formation protein
MRLILASGSATRAALLRSARVDFLVRPAHVDERVLETPLIAAGRTPSEIAAALAEEKALEVSRREPDALVIGADQILDLAGERFTKSENRAAARAQFARLSGKTHQLHSAVAVAENGSISWHGLASASLTMRALTESEIDAYLAAAGDVVTESVGGYQVENAGIRLFDRVDGDHATILGLPLIPLFAYLRSRGILSW